MLDDFIDQSADYVKASRFFHEKPSKLCQNIANLGTYSYLYSPNFSTGYYSITDITNGCGWLRREIIEKVDFSIVEKRYDYETSMLTALSIANAKVIDHAVPAHYGDEKINHQTNPDSMEKPKGCMERILAQNLL